MFLGSVLGGSGQSNAHKCMNKAALTSQPSPTTVPCALTSAIASTQDEPLDAAGTAAAFESLTSEVNASEAASGKPGNKSVDEVAMGFVRVANEAMCRPIR